MPLYEYTIQLDDKISNPFGSVGRKGQAAYDRLNKGQKVFNQEVDKGTSKVNNFSGGISRLTGLFGGFLGLQAGKTILGWGADMESTRISFQTLTGDVEKGNKLFSDINQFANVTPFNNKTLQDSANTMLAFGISLDRIMPNLGMLGDVAQGDANKMKSLTLAFSQVQSQGKLMGQDLLQFINAGFNPLKILSDQTGKSMATLKDEMSKGGISAGMVSEAFKVATSEGGLFFNMMEKQSATMGGKWSTLVGTIQNKLGGFIETNSGYFNRLLDGLISTVNWMSENTNVLATFFGVLGTGFALYKTWVLWNQRVAIWQAIVAATNPAMLIVAGLAALAAGVVWAWNKFEGFRGSIMGVWEVMKGLADLVKNYVINRFKELLGGLGALGSAFVSLFKGDFSKAKDLALDGFKKLGGVETKKAAWEAAKGLGEKFNEGYQKGVDAKPIKNPLSAMGAGSAGAMASTAGGSATGGGIADSSAVQAGMAGITGGGQRNTNINITIGDLVRELNINAETVTEGVDDMYEKVVSALTRVVNSSNRIAYQQ